MRLSQGQYLDYDERPQKHSGRASFRGAAANVSVFVDKKSVGNNRPAANTVFNNGRKQLKKIF